MINKLFMWGFVFVVSFIAYVGFILPFVFSLNTDFMFGIFALGIVGGYFYFKFVATKFFNLLLYRDDNNDSK